jgi:hypothetical protein
VTSNDPSSGVVTVFLQGEGVCDENIPSVDKDELEILAQITFATELNPTFTGIGRIPLTIHSCKAIKNGVQVVGKGKVGFEYYAKGAGCTKTGSVDLDAIILPSGLEVGNGNTVFIKVDFPAQRKSSTEAQVSIISSASLPVSVRVILCLHFLL